VVWHAVIDLLSAFTVSVAGRIVAVVVAAELNE
jgi:hypothetical protein